MRIRVPATSANLGSGFDCLGLALDIWMTVDVDFTASGVRVENIGQGQDYLPTDEHNFFIRVINRVLRDWAHPPVNGIHLVVKNEIPLSRGLGSSAAATIASIKIASEIAHKRISGEEAISIATQIEGHSDNAAAAYYGGLVLSSIRDRAGLHSYQLPLRPKVPSVLLAIPDFRLRTAEARRVLPRQVSVHDAVYNSSRTALAVYAWTSGEYDLLRQAMQDRVHQYYRMSLIPGAQEMLQVAYRCKGIYGSALSGSGSTMIAFGEKENLAYLALLWQRIWTRNSIEGKLVYTNISNCGVKIDH